LASRSPSAWAAAANFAGIYMRRFRGGKMALDVQHAMRTELFDSLSRLDGARQDEIHTGQLVGRSISDLTMIQALLSMVPLLMGSAVLFVGSLSARKNIRRLIEAWRNCRHSDAHLVLAGGVGAIGLAGGELPDLPPRTIVIGRIDDADLPALFSAATLFVYPSVYEGFGLPPLEAMACGTPCLVSNLTSIPEVAGPAAREVDAYDVPELTRALDELLGDVDLLQRMREAGLSHVKRFTWDSTALRTHEILQRFTDEGGRALAFSTG